MTNREGPYPTGSSRFLGVWLCLLALVACVIVVIPVDTRRDPRVPLQVKTPTSVVARPLDKPTTIDNATRESPMIRVNLTPGGASHLTLEVRGPYEVRKLGDGTVLGKGNSLASAGVKATPAGLKIGSTPFAATQLEIVARHDGTICVNEHLYRGCVRLFRQPDGLMMAVNVLPLEEYLASVVDSEMPATFPEAARQAQAIVSRTYALYRKSQANPAAHYDLFSTQRSQQYLGVEYPSETGRRLAGESTASRKAVTETTGMVCTYHGRMFCTYFSAACGGKTTIGTEVFSDAAPVLKSVNCDWCRESKYYRWTAQMPRREFLDGLKDRGEIRRLTSISQSSGPAGGTISRFRFFDGGDSLDLTGVEIRDRFPAGTIRSPRFTLTLERDQVRIEGRGHGHGAGFCQWGARGLALTGKTAQQIIQHYYPGAALVRNGPKKT